LDDGTVRPNGLAPGPGQVWTFVGDGFLYKMVRNLVGTLVEIGQGKRPAADIAAALAMRERRYCGQTAPAKGLTLVGVDYQQGALPTGEEGRS
jgi:tRNA pseudouridine38-40 synthase